MKNLSLTILFVGLGFMLHSCGGSSSSNNEAFEALKESLKSTAPDIEDKNRDLSQMMKAAIDEETAEGNMKNLWMKQGLDEVEKKTTEVIVTLNGMIQDVEMIAGYDPATGEYQNMSETGDNGKYWRNGKAAELKAKLNSYVDWANDFMRRTDTTGRIAAFEKIAKDDPERGSWEEVTFGNKPVIADLAYLEKLKMDVRDIQAEILMMLRSRISGMPGPSSSGELLAISAPRSRVVTAGTKFETTLFLAMAAPDLMPEFAGSGGLTVNPDGRSATFTIMAAGGFAKGTYEKEQSYYAIVKVPRADGGVEELKIEDKFIVRKPEVIITSPSVQILYKGCGNALTVNVPSLGEFFNPVFSASDADVLSAPADKKQCTVVPRGSTCIFSIKSNTNGQLILVDEIKYRVIDPPRPEIVMTVDEKPFDGLTPVSKKSTLLIKLKADPDFQAAMPKDARYRISGVSLLLRRSLGVPTKVATFKSDPARPNEVQVGLGNQLKEDVPGTLFFVKVEKVYRQNFQNKEIEVEFNDTELLRCGMIK